MKKSLSTFFLILIVLFSPTCLFAKYDYTLPKKTEKAIPILVYHLVSDNIFSKNTDLFVKPKEFERQIKWISENGFTTIFANELFVGKNYSKPIVLTFDDGYIDNYEIVFQLAKKYNVKFTIFIITDALNTRNNLTSAQVLEMYNSGLVSIQSHTKSHSDLQKLDSSQLEAELKQSREVLFKLLGKNPTVISYPFGSINYRVIEAVEKYYLYGYSTSNGNLSNGCNKFMIKRFGVSRGTTLDNIKKYINEIN